MTRVYILIIAIAFAACASIKPTDVVKPVVKEDLAACINNKIHNRGYPSFEVLKDIIEAVRAEPDSVFAENANADVYGSVKAQLGPYTSIKHRRAVMAQVMIVQAGFESSWKYGEGRDMKANNTAACTEEAGLYQTSGNMNTFSPEAKAVLQPFMAGLCKSTTCAEFKRCTKEPVKAFVHGHFMRASRITTRHWGPMVRKEINPWLKKECVSAIEALL